MVYVENLCPEDILEEHMAMKSANTSEDEEYGECFSESEEDGVNDKHERVAPNEGCSISDLQILYNAACIIRNTLQNAPDLRVPWPPLASDLTSDNSKTIVLYPCLLHLRNHK